MSTAKKITAVIVDDEETGRKTLLNLLNEYCPEVEVVAMADSAASGFTAIRQCHPELVFLDVRMPAADEGFQLLESLDDLDFSVIFTTSYNEYAIRAIKFSALDYLLKPIDILELQKAVARYARKRGRSDRQAIHHLTNAANAGPLKKLGLPAADEVTFVNIDDIVRCEADSNCTVFYLTNRQKILVTKTLKYYDNLLEDTGFYRIHDSHLINLRHIKKYLKEGVALMSDGSQVYVSARKKKGFLDKLNEGFA
ncbi:DNA-binding response regulator [Sphingobacteriales bacterium UPWRP_1]|nr:DNA-binding response regulator [Sphingobacteriales bacterium UPWRP_1]